MVQRCCFTVMLFIVCSAAVIAKSTENLVLTYEKPHFDFFDANRIENGLSADGQVVSAVPTGGAGMRWPQTDSTYVIYASGLGVVGWVGDGIRSAWNQKSGGHSLRNAGNALYFITGDMV